jgi:hypothetical protein
MEHMGNVWGVFDLLPAIGGASPRRRHAHWPRRRRARPPAIAIEAIKAAVALGALQGAPPGWNQKHRIFLCFSYVFPMIFLWCSYVFPLFVIIFLWCSYVFPMNFPLLFICSYEFPMFVPWFSYVFAWFSYECPTCFHDFPMNMWDLLVL